MLNLSQTQTQNEERKKMLKVSCDDGSTNVKLAWLEDGEVRTSLSGNSFKEGWNPGLFNAGKVNRPGNPGD